MEVLLESEEQMGRNKGKGKRQHPNGPSAPSPAAVAGQTGRLLAEREADWLERLVKGHRIRRQTIKQLFFPN